MEEEAKITEVSVKKVPKEEEKKEIITNGEIGEKPKVKEISFDRSYR